MARFRDESVIGTALAAQLEAGESLRHQAYGVRQPPVWLIAFGYLLGILPGVVIAAKGTREYLIGLTDRRFIALRFKGSGIAVQEVQAWRLDALPPVTSSTGGLFTHIAVQDPAQPFVAKFHRLGTSDNRPQAMAIAAALGRGAAG